MLAPCFYSNRSQQKLIYAILWGAKQQNLFIKESIPMAKVRKRRQPKKKLPQVSEKTRIYNRKRTFAEKFLIVMGVVIVLSMVLSLIISRGGF